MKPKKITIKTSGKKPSKRNVGSIRRRSILEDKPKLEHVCSNNSPSRANVINEDLFRLKTRLFNEKVQVNHDANFLKNKDKIKQKWRGNTLQVKHRKYKVASISPGLLQIGP